MKNHLLDYTKEQKYYTRQNNDIYLRAKPHLPTAIANAKSCGEFDFENPCGIGISEMHKLFEDLKLTQ